MNKSGDSNPDEGVRWQRYVLNWRERLRIGRSAYGRVDYRLPKVLIAVLGVITVLCVIASYCGSELAGIAVGYFMIPISLLSGCGLHYFRPILLAKGAEREEKFLFWCGVVAWIYVSSYFLMVSRTHWSGGYYGVGWNWYPFQESYWIDGDLIRFFYSPINAADRWLRPSFWQHGMYIEHDHFHRAS